MKIIWSNVVIFLILLSSICLGLFFYPIMPDEMASHWDMYGNVDGYLPKFWALFIPSLCMLSLSVLFYLIPKIDPLKANIEKFKDHYKQFIMILFVFLLTIQLQIILWNIGVRISPNIYLPVSSGVLFYYLGVLCENARPNWFIGIKTPWTLTSNRVWERTHKLGGKLFKWCGLSAITGILIPHLWLYLIVVPIVLVSIFTVVYSYVEFQKIIS